MKLGSVQLLIGFKTQSTNNRIVNLWFEYLNCLSLMYVKPFVYQIEYPSK